MPTWCASSTRRAKQLRRQAASSCPRPRADVGWNDLDHRLRRPPTSAPARMTSSSYPRIVKEWKRGTPLASAVTVYEGAHEDMSVSAYRDNTPGFERDFVSRQIDFYESENLAARRRRQARQDRRARRFAGRDHARVDADRAARPTGPWAAPPSRRARCWPRSSTTTWRAGASSPLLFEPDDTTALDSHSWTRNHLIAQRDARRGEPP